MANRLRLVATLAAVAGLVLPTAGSAVATNSVPPKKTFAYTGSEQSYVVPAGVVLLGVAVEGGHGGEYAAQAGEGGGRDGGVGALLPVTPHEKLYVEVGSAGVYAGGPVFGGGGAAGAPPPVVCRTSQGAACSAAYASSGGGASDVRTCSLSAGRCPGGVSPIASRLIVGGGGGGQGGSGNGPMVQCGASSGGGRANSFQYPPGKAGAGPLPVTTAAGTVYPGYPTSDDLQNGVTPAGGGRAAPGAGGRQAGCSSGSTGFTDSVAGSQAAGPVGGTGGNASSLGPMYSGCVQSTNDCFDAGAGGGGGGGYFGGGGGATGLDKSTGSCGVCNGAGSGQGGGGGSSFVSKRMRYPVDESLVKSAWNGWAIVVPVIEIDSPAPGAVYHPGHVVRARWACGYDGQTGLGISQKCVGSVAEGKAISTRPGKHSFKVSGVVQSNGNHTVTATATYTVK